MKLFVDEKERLVVTSLQELDSHWKSITSDCFKQGKLVHYTIIDGQKLYDQYENVLINRFNDIKEVRIITIGYRESYVLSLNEMSQYLLAMRQAIKGISTVFYGQPNESAMNQLMQFSDGLGWIYHTSMFIESLANHDSAKVNASGLEAIVGIRNASHEMLAEIESLIEKQDYVAIGDYLTYECIPRLQKSQQDIEEIVNYGEYSES